VPKANVGRMLLSRMPLLRKRIARHCGCRKELSFMTKSDDGGCTKDCDDCDDAMISNNNNLLLVWVPSFCSNGATTNDQKRVLMLLLDDLEEMTTIGRREMILVVAVR
jgi:hypothetical protein